MQPAFHRDRVAAYGRYIVEATLDMLRRWGVLAARGESLDVSVEMGALILRIALKALFGLEIGERALELAAVLAPADILATPLRPGDKRGKEAFQALAEEIVETRFSNDDRGPDVLSVLLDAVDPATGESPSYEDLLGEVRNLLLASFDTTSNALSWTWFLLAENEEPRRRLHAELDQVLEGRHATAEDIPALVYTRRIFDEALRLYPPGWIIGRKTLEPDPIDGGEVPAHTMVALCPYTMQRHPSFWEEPDRFDPDRFAPDRAVGRPRFAYFPFGGGPRQCIGEGLALTEAVLVIATVAQRYELSVSPGFRVRPEGRNIIRPRGGLLMSLAERPRRNEGRRG